MRRCHQLVLSLISLAALLVAGGTPMPSSASDLTTEDGSRAPVDFAGAGHAVGIEVSYDRPGTTIWAPTVQLAFGYTEASVTEDPTVHGVGSSIYPGGLILVCTEGVSGRCPVAYPLWARSTSPGDKIDAPAGQQWTSPDGSVAATSQTSHSETTDAPSAVGTASVGSMTMVDLLSVDSVQSRSESLWDKGTVVSRATSMVQGISLFGGSLVIRSLHSASMASLGNEPAAKSGVQVQGAVLDGKEITIDSGGVRVIDPAVPADQADEASKALNEQLLKHFGARVRLAEAPTVTKPDLVTSETAGLRITFSQSEGGQGAPWCDPARGLPPISNCKQFDTVEFHLGSTSAAVSRTLGGAEDDDGGFSVGFDEPLPSGEPALDVGAGAGSGPSAPAGDSGFVEPEMGLGGIPVAESFGSRAGPTQAAFDDRGGSFSGAPVPDGAAAPSAVQGAPPVVDADGEQALASPIRRVTTLERVRGGEILLLILGWLAAIACLLILLRRARFARARAAELGL